MTCKRSAVDEGRAFSVDDYGIRAEERRLLLVSTGIAEGVVAQIEAAGITSIDELVHVGAEEVIRRICVRCGSTVFRNRLSALRRFVEAYVVGGAEAG